MQQLPSFESYTETDNGNTLVFSLGKVDVYFSYKTPVAFRRSGVLTVRQNEWGQTTGRHLSAIDGGSKETKARRVPGIVFEECLRAILED